MTGCLYAGTLPGVDLGTRIAVAGESGFESVSISPPEAAGFLDHGRSAELIELLDRHRMRLGCLDPVVGWVPNVRPAHPAHAPFAAFGTERCLEQAERLDIPLLNVIDVGWQPLPEAALAGLAGLVERAGRSGVAVAVEFQVYSAVPDLATAGRLCRGSGADLMIDAWHFFRSGAVIDDLRGGPGRVRVRGVQLSDGAAVPGADPVIESTQARLLPGSGGFDLAGLLRVVGPDRPTVGVEVFNRAHTADRSLPVARAAQHGLRETIAAAQPQCPPQR
ncbi:sugar phosphate isomerase/epimerase family protein [Microlunatus soli]|uniref:sugar phosphate isomerase/epimerase family protein n=1 Tax=Microlunatus soli TaxID=630515 RepID=UPI0012F7812C|nr:sugar phosphate isomerase/epimerase [Microlunatus soli]